MQNYFSRNKHLEGSYSRLHRAASNFHSSTLTTARHLFTLCISRQITLILDVKHNLCEHLEMKSKFALKMEVSSFSIVFESILRKIRNGTFPYPVTGNASESFLQQCLSLRA